jgi:hypothetical protein
LSAKDPGVPMALDKAIASLPLSSSLPPISFSNLLYSVWYISSKVFGESFKSSSKIIFFLGSATTEAAISLKSAPPPLGNSNFGVSLISSPRVTLYVFPSTSIGFAFKNSNIFSAFFCLRSDSIL